jgi:hypothetical protein
MLSIQPVAPALMALETLRVLKVRAYDFHVGFRLDARELLRRPCWSHRSTTFSAAFRFPADQASRFSNQFDLVLRVDSVFGQPTTLREGKT